ncbi:MAG: tellurite resistance TerB family protein [Geminicoccaceae bacterium]|nr:tellurite resistance TerB family protein [Geminicoccaceae bacterium]
MFDAEKLLRGLAKGGLSRGGMVKGGGMMLLGGLAYAAFEHFTRQQDGPATGPSTRPPIPPQGFAETGRTQPPPLPGMASAAGGATPPPLPHASGTGQAPQSLPGPGQERAVLLVRAMIAAAKADGEIDAGERAAILSRLDEQGMGQEAHAFVEAEMARPLDLYEITSGVRDAATAADVYAASLLAITVDTDAERRYLDRLASRLGLDDGAAAAIEAKLAEASGGEPGS